MRAPGFGDGNLEGDTATQTRSGVMALVLLLGFAHFEGCAPALYARGWHFDTYLAARDIPTAIASPRARHKAPSRGYFFRVLAGNNLLEQFLVFLFAHGLKTHQLRV
jgi:hypothetical protein